MDTSISVTFDGARHEIRKFGLSDLVAFEKHFGVSASVFQPEEGEEPTDLRMEWICFLVWRGLRKLGVIEKTLPFDDDFIDRIDEVDATNALPDGDTDPPTQAPAQ